MKKLLFIFLVSASFMKIYGEPIENNDADAAIDLVGILVNNLITTGEGASMAIEILQGKSYIKPSPEDCIALDLAASLLINNDKFMGLDSSNAREAALKLLKQCNPQNPQQAFNKIVIATNQAENFVRKVKHVERQHADNLNLSLLRALKPEKQVCKGLEYILASAYLKTKPPKTDEEAGVFLQKASTELFTSLLACTLTHSDLNQGQFSRENLDKESEKTPGF